LPSPKRKTLTPEQTKSLRIKFACAVVLGQKLEQVFAPGNSGLGGIVQSLRRGVGYLSPPVPAYAVVLREIEHSSEYKSLFDSPSFRRARKQALRLASAAESDEMQSMMEEIAKSNDPSALRELIFLRIVFHPIGMYYARKSAPIHFAPPSAEERKSARSAAVKLRHFLKKTGVASLDAARTTQLDRDLDKLIDELDSSTKRPRNDDSYFERRFVAEIDAAITKAYRTSMPTVVSELAALIGYTPHHRNITRARAKRSQAPRSST
jgi:hypothetical protein